MQDRLVLSNRLNHYGDGTACQGQAQEVKNGNEDAEVLVISFSDADSEPGTVVIVPFYAMVAVAAVDGSEGTIDVALNAVLGADRYPVLTHREEAVFVFEYMVDRGQEDQLFVPLVVVHVLGYNPGICVDAQE